MATLPTSTPKMKLQILVSLLIWNFIEISLAENSDEYTEPSCDYSEPYSDYSEPPQNECNEPNQYEYTPYEYSTPTPYEHSTPSHCEYSKPEPYEYSESNHDYTEPRPGKKGAGSIASSSTKDGVSSSFSKSWSYADNSDEVDSKEATQIYAPKRSYLVLFCRKVISKSWTDHICNTHF